MLIIVMVLGLTIWIFDAIAPPVKKAAIGGAVPPTSFPSPTPTPVLSPAENLAKAKEQMEQFFCKHGCQSAVQYLEAIPSGAKEHKEAVRLLTVLKQRLAKGEAILKREAEKQEAEKRKVGAENVERGMLSKGYDMTVTVSGRGNRTIKITYVLMNRPLVYQMVEAGMLNQLREQGFHKVIFADGYGTWWSYDL